MKHWTEEQEENHTDGQNEGEVKAERVVKCNHCGESTTLVNGLYIRQKRERVGISLRELAKRMKLSPSYMSDIENNRRNCRTELGSKILNEL